MSDMTEHLLRGLLSVTARQAFPPERLAEIVGRDRQRKAYNLCNGGRTQREIAKASGVDPGNLNRTLLRLVREGVVFPIGDGKSTRYLHVYPLPDDIRQKAGTKKGGRE